MDKGLKAYTSRFLYAILRPVAAFCLSRSYKFQDFIDIVKRVFIDEAISELKKRDAVISTSKISIMTGLQRKDITRLRDTGAHDESAESNLTSRIIGLWSSRRFADAKGKPKKLTIDGKESQFASLVSEVSNDLNHRTILFELLRLDLISVDKNIATLKVPAFIVRGSTEKSLPILSLDVHDLIHSVDINLTHKNDTPLLHARTDYDNIPQEHIPKIRNWLLEAGQKFHREARAFLSHYDRDTNKNIKKGSGRSRVSLGTFSFVEDLESDSKKKERQ